MFLLRGAVFCFLSAVPASAQFTVPTPRPIGGGIGSADVSLLRQAWTEDLEAHRLLSSLSHYAPDAMYLGPKGTRVEGLHAIRALLEDDFTHFDTHIQLTSHTSSQSGDLAYDSGSYIEDRTERQGHTVQHLHGDYLTIYHRAGPVQWQIVQQVWTAAPREQDQSS